MKRGGSIVVIAARARFGTSSSHPFRISPPLLHSTAVVQQDDVDAVDEVDSSSHISNSSSHSVCEYRRYQYPSSPTLETGKFTTLSNSNTSGISILLSRSFNGRSSRATDHNKINSPWRRSKLHHVYHMIETSIAPFRVPHSDDATRRIIHGRRGFRRTHMGHAHDPDPVHQRHNSYDKDGSEEAGERVSRMGLIADVFLTVGKGFAGYVSGSTAIIADAAHSMSDVVLSGVALWIFKAARAPKDQMHPYGHGKFETLGALGISSMLIFTGVGIGWHAFQVIQGFVSTIDGATLISSIGPAVEHTATTAHSHAHGVQYHGIDKEYQALALTAALLSIGVKEGLFWITKKVGDARGSELLKANAWHHRSDAISSVIALLGVGGAMLGWNFLDPAAGLLVSGLIIRAGLQTGYQSLQELVDSALPDSVLSPFKETVMSISSVKGCHALRGRRAGSSIHLDVHIEVDPWMSVSAAHRVGESVQQKLKESHPFLEEVFIHVDPEDTFPTSTSARDIIETAKRNGQVHTNCSHQQNEIEAAVRALVETSFAKIMTFERARCHFLQGRLLVELEVSMDPTILISDATKYAELAERKIMDAHQDIFAVETQLRLTRHL